MQTLKRSQTEVQDYPDYEILYGPGSEWLTELRSPHPNLWRVYGNVPVRSLGEQLDIPAMQQNLSDAAQLGQSAYEDMRIQVAEQVGNIVHRTLFFTPGMYDHRTDKLIRPDLRWISSSQKANCYGFTLVTSSLLERIGVDHGIGFVNGHAIIILFSGLGDTGETWLVDATNPKLSRTMTGLTDSVDLEQARMQVTETGRAVTAISTLSYASELPVDQLAQTYFWLMKGTAVFGPKAAEQSLDHRTRLTLTIFNMTNGRIALEGYLNYRNAMAANKPNEAAQALVSMPGLYPELDPDALEHALIREMTVELCQNGDSDSETLAQALHAYFSSFGDISHPAVVQLRDDCWKKLAEHA